MRAKRLGINFIIAVLIVGVVIGVFVTQRARALSIFSSSDTPATITDQDSVAVELGMKFRSSVATQVTGVKFYKGPQNTGTHIGSLWTSTGTKLASVTFAGESASGWQTAMFATPVSIAANTTYVISYFAPNGKYSSNENYFTTAHTNGTLTALQDGADGGNGVYRYTASSAFPNSTWGASNYWVDVVTASSDTTSPSVSVTAPAAGSTISGTTTITATASDNVAVSSVQFKVDGTNVGTADTTSPYSASWDTIAVTNGSHILTAVATDSSGNTATSSNVTVTVDNQEPPVSDTSLWSSNDTPAVVADSDPASVELGAKFRVSQATNVKAIKFYKGPGNTGTHTGSLWASNGTKLASVTFGSETASGWQTAQLATPVAINANTTYVVSYYAPNGHYAINENYFASPRISGILTGLQDGTDGGNGVYRYGSASSFPINAWNASNYWVDVIVGSMSSDTTPPVVSNVTPAHNATNVATNIAPSTVFNEALDAATVNASSVQLKSAMGQTISATVAYVPSSHTVTITPAAALEQNTQYSVTLTTAIKDTAGNALAANYTWSFTTAAPIIDPVDPLSQGHDGPVLVITRASQPISTYYSEILRAEGLNSFKTVDLGAVNSTLLAQYDVAILADLSLTDAQVTSLTDWVNAGGNLIAMSPDKKLASLFGLTDQATILSEGYLKINTGTVSGTGITGETMQYHGSADRYGVEAGTSTIATLYSDASTATTSPAVTLRSVGTNGGQAVAFTYDLATSIVRTHQGNPAWDNTNRDPYTAIRPNDLFYGNAANDPQQDYINMNKVAIPQADEQQRLFANIVLEVNRDRKPLPKFAYFPYNKKAVMVMTGDDHNGSGAGPVFDAQLAASPAGCSADDWECVRSTAMMYTNSALTPTQAQTYTSQGFEIGLHVNPGNETGAPSDPGCGYWTKGAVSWLGNEFDSQLQAWRNLYPTLPTQMTTRNHCALWSDYATSAKVEAARGLRVDLNYYYWPGGWVQNRPGFFTGSGIPMRFTDLTGSMIDTYQVPSHLVNESDIVWPAGIATQLDRALGPEGYYGAFGTHYDYRGDNFETMLLQQAQQRGVPLVSGKQLGVWTDARNNSYFTNETWSGQTYTFTATVDNRARSMMRTLLPYTTTKGTLTSLTKDGAPLAYTTETMKGVTYAVFTTTTGNYAATYTIDTTPPTVTVLTPANGATNVSPIDDVVAVVSKPLDPSTVNTNTVLLQNGNVIVPAVITYDAANRKVTINPSDTLTASTTYTVRLTTGLKDLSGNALAGEYISSFTTGIMVYSVWSPTPQSVSAATGDTASVEIGLKFTSSQSGSIRSILFYKAMDDGQTNHTVTLWGPTGSSLGTAVTTNESTTGWQTATFASPIAVTAGTVYTASYHAPVGRYAYTSGSLAAAITNGPLTAQANGGVFNYGTGMPTTSYNATNYWVDVVFAP